jgi:hypothetical protein
MAGGTWLASAAWRGTLAAVKHLGRPKRVSWKSSCRTSRRSLQSKERKASRVVESPAMTIKTPACDRWTL